MKLAIASGKGGTGKTTVATSLATRLVHYGQTVSYVDTDVDAPNGHLFLRPVIHNETSVGRLVPRVIQDMCRFCGACARICRFNAIVSLRDKTIVFSELCQSCGGCVLVCRAEALTEESHVMGVVKTGVAGGVQFASGTLQIGETSNPALIRATKKAAAAADWMLLDAPPGTACAMMEAVRDCDYMLLVTEPTPFGLHDLRLAVEVAKVLEIPCGVVINRAQPEAGVTREFCAQAKVPVLAEIPDDVAIAKAYAQGALAVEAIPILHSVFDGLVVQLLHEVRAEVSPSPQARQRLENAIYAGSKGMTPDSREPLEGTTQTPTISLLGGEAPTTAQQACNP